MDLKEVLSMAQMRDEKGRFCKATTNNNTTLNKEKMKSAYNNFAPKKIHLALI